jgi:AbrB family looped-hinge helix DNA binding protein
MAMAQSRLTSQGQVSVPAPVRRKLGVGPGSVLEWHDAGDQVIVRRAGRFSSKDVHDALFPTPPKPRSLAHLKAGVAADVKRRRARR